VHDCQSVDEKLHVLQGARKAFVQKAKQETNPSWHHDWGNS